MELFKLLSASQIVAQVVSFLILFVLLRLLVWKKFLKILDDRKERIASEFKGIEDAKAQTVKLRGEYEAKLTKIEDAARAKMQEAIAEGKGVAAEIEKSAEAQAQKLILAAKDTVKDELSKAREVLKDDIVDLAIEVAEKVVQEKLTEKTDRKMVEEFLEGVEKK
ncbi:MAG: F0F1 ATP synthase subunit B [Candidatus Omnitrophota bacterium]|nr:F0F1 ATP synthase subunit B [Candidatus Omnitrophota bacterium]